MGRATATVENVPEIAYLNYLANLQLGSELFMNDFLSVTRVTRVSIFVV